MGTEPQIIDTMYDNASVRSDMCVCVCAYAFVRAASVHTKNEIYTTKLILLSMDAQLCKPSSHTGHTQRISSMHEQASAII